MILKINWKWILFLLFRKSWWVIGVKIELFKIIFIMFVIDLNKIIKVVVYLLVFLSVVDYFNWMGKVGNVKWVVGVLLGLNR